MDIRETTPPEAYAALQSDPAAVYLDVRTEGEFEAGHPAGARNVPVVFFDPATRQPTPNPDFVATVERIIPRTAKLLVGCQSGPRQRPSGSRAQPRCCSSDGASQRSSSRTSAATDATASSKITVVGMRRI